MNERTPFDDLARRKLNERSFHVPPHAWDAVERELEAMDRRRTPNPWWLLLLLLPVGGALWHFGGDTTATPETSVAKNEMVNEGPSAATNALAVTGESIAAPVTPAGERSTLSPMVMGTAATADAPPVWGSDAPPSSGAMRASSDVTPQADPSAPERKAAEYPMSSSTSADPALPGPAITTAPAAITTHKLSDRSVVYSPSNTESEARITESGMSMPSVADVASDVADEDLEITITLVGTNATATSPADTLTMSMAGVDTLPITQPPHAVPAAPAPQDSLTTAPVDPLPGSAPPGPRLILTAWGAAFHTRTRYTGSATDDWATDHAGSTTFGWGAELMRMGDHFGVGVGLHLLTYAEDMHSRDLRRSWTEHIFTWQLQGVDTTLLQVTGTTVINGQVYQVTQSVDTTVLVLVSSTGTVAHEDVQRTALEQRNRTSYLEIPLLLEARTGVGRWEFAVRGGPTVGALRGRRGLLPGSTGYTDMHEADFRALVLGWTAHGVVRFRLGERWTMGAGPALRGQLFNTLDGTDLVRRSTAWGGQFSVGWQLP